MPQLETIKKSEQPGMISSFWSMLQELESRAENALDKHLVESYYSQWNRITGSEQSPRWVKDASKNSRTNPS
jgi:hypothetical protein